MTCVHAELAGAVGIIVKIKTFVTVDLCKAISGRGSLLQEILLFYSLNKLQNLDSIDLLEEWNPRFVNYSAFYTVICPKKKVSFFARGIGCEVWFYTISESIIFLFFRWEVLIYSILHEKSSGGGAIGDTVERHSFFFSLVVGETCLPSCAERDRISSRNRLRRRQCPRESAIYLRLPAEPSPRRGLPPLRLAGSPIRPRRSIILSLFFLTWTDRYFSLSFRFLV